MAVSTVKIWLDLHVIGIATLDQKELFLPVAFY